MTNHQANKHKKGVCVTLYCLKPSANHSNYCHSCNKARYAEKNPVKYAFANLKTNAKRRGKEFSLTLEQFEKFAVETSYMERKVNNTTGCILIVSTNPRVTISTIFRLWKMQTTGANTLRHGKPWRAVHFRIAI